MNPMSSRKQLAGTAVGLVLIVGLLGAAYYAKNQADARADLRRDRQQAAVGVSVVTVGHQPVPIRLAVRGFLRGFAEVMVPAEVAGRVVERAVAEGQTVGPSDLLCRLDDTLHRIAVREAEANVALEQSRAQQAESRVSAAVASVARAQAVRDNAKLEFERTSQLYAEHNAPKIEFDRQKSSLRETEAAVQWAEAELERTRQEQQSAAASSALAEARLDHAHEMLRRCSIPSPLAGNVNRLPVEVGEYVLPGMPVAEIISSDRFKLNVELTGQQLALLDGQPAVSLAIDAIADRTFPLQLHHVAAKADPQSRRFRVEFHLDNTDGLLRAGMFGECRMVADGSRQIMTLPGSAITRRFGQNHCYVVSQKDGQAQVQLRRIETRPLVDMVEHVRVLAGLAEGEMVIVSADDELREGSLIEVRSVRDYPMLSDPAVSLSSQNNLPNDSAAGG